MKEASLSPNETQRLAALNTLNILDTPPEERFDRITRLAQYSFKAPIALISFVDEKRQWIKSGQGLSVAEIPRSHSFCAHAILSADTFIIPDARRDQRFADNPLVTGEANICAYMGQPLTTPDGSRVGTLSLIDHQPHAWDDREQALLKDLATMVEQELKMAQALRQAEDALHRVEEKQGAILENIEYGYYEFDLAGTFTFFNRATPKIFGYPAAELLGLNYRALTDETDAARAFAAFNQLYRTGKPIKSLEWKIVSKDGQRKYIEMSALLIKDAAGEPAGFQGFGRDITRRKETQEKLYRYAERIETLREIDRAILAARSPAEIVAVALNHLQHLIPYRHAAVALFNETVLLTVKANDKARTALEEQLSLDAFDDLTRLQQGKIHLIEDIPALPKRTAYYERLLAEGVHSLLKAPLIAHGDLIGALNLGMTEPHLFNTEHIEIAEEAADVLAVAIHDAQLDATRQQTRQIAETLQAANQALTQSLDLETVLQALLDYLGQLVPYDSATVMLRENETQTAVYALRGYEQWTDAAQIQTIVFDIETTPNIRQLLTTQQGFLIPDTHNYPGWRIPPGNEHVRNWLGMPLRLGDRIIGLYSLDKTQPNFFTAEHLRLAEALAPQAAIAIQNARLFEQVQGYAEALEQRVTERTAELTSANARLRREIAERKRIEEALIETRDQALEASRLKTELLARVSHELRTPLGAILGFAEMLEAGVYGPIDAEQEQAIQDIIHSSQYLKGLVNELLDQAQLEGEGLELQMSRFAPEKLVEALSSKMSGLAKAKGLRLTIDIAANMPETIEGDLYRLQQILLNLVGNAVKFTPQGEVRVCFYRADAAHWAIQVSDTGPGIPAEAQVYIFEPFRQVDGSITRKYGGAGLGLSLVKQLTTLMGGQISLESEPGQGSRFTILLPLEP